MAFRIRERVAAHQGKTDTELDTELDPAGTGGYMGLSVVYRSIDFMVHLVGDYKYFRLYGPLRPTLDHLTTKLANLPAGDDTHAYIRAKAPDVIRILDDMKTITGRVDQAIADGTVPAHLKRHIRTGATRLELRVFYEHRFYDAAGQPDWEIGALVEKWRDIEALLGDFICMPWVSIQANTSAKTVPPIVMDYHINDIGQNTILDFYNESHANTKLVQAIEFGRYCGLIYRPYSRLQHPIDHQNIGNIVVITPPRHQQQAMTPGGGGGTNNRICLESGGVICGYTANKFCSVNEEGTGCSAASDH
ncbi:MAG: hypothetical protein GC168_13460 [Candidatus Hydrogenedens sp.]|nr:hypothetical protein [Candidatus Hydrogenedens sp.]